MSDDRPLGTEPRGPEPRSPEPHRRYRSVFWPTVLIGVGLVWLLANLQLLSEANLWMLLRLWPLALIAIGLDLLVGRRWPVLGALIGLGIVGLALVLMLFGPRFGLAAEEQPAWFGLPVIRLGDSRNVQTSEFSESLGNAASARVDLNLHEGRSTVGALAGSGDLIRAKLTHLGQIIFEVRGDQQKMVVLDQSPGDEFARWFTRSDLPWDIRLSPAIPLDLRIRGGSGAASLDAGGLSLSALEVTGGSGSTSLTLPGGDSYRAHITAGSGSFRMDVPKDADLGLTANIGSGSFVMNVSAVAQMQAELTAGSGSTMINLPDDMATRVEVRHRGSGSVSLASSLKRVSGSDKDTGVWETPGYSDTGRHVELVLSGGSGSITVR